MGLGDSSFGDCWATGSKNVGLCLLLLGLGTSLTWLQQGCFPETSAFGALWTPRLCMLGMLNGWTFAFKFVFFSDFWQG
jgi:hypothetical protein